MLLILLFVPTVSAYNVAVSFEHPDCDVNLFLSSLEIIRPTESGFIASLHSANTCVNTTLIMRIIRF